MKTSLLKFATLLILLLCATIIASAYGALQNQISYSFSSEYFTKFKFTQFNIPWATESPKLGAAMVGVLESWWMGLLIAPFISLPGIFFPTPRIMFIKTVESFFLVIVICILFNAWGFLEGYLNVTEANIKDYPWANLDLKEPVQFIRAGLMHNKSYIGVIVGFCIGLVWQLLQLKSIPKTILQHPPVEQSKEE